MPERLDLTPEQDSALERAWVKLSAKWAQREARRLPKLRLSHTGDLIVDGDNHQDGAGTGEASFAEETTVLEALEAYASCGIPLPLAEDDTADFARRLPGPYEEGKHPRGYHGKWMEAHNAHQQAEKVLSAHERTLGKSAEKIEKLRQAHEAAQAAHKAAKSKSSATAATREGLATHKAQLAAITAKGKWETAKAAHAALRKIHGAAKKEHTRTKRELKVATKAKETEERAAGPAPKAKAKAIQATGRKEPQTPVAATKEEKAAAPQLAQPPVTPEDLQAKSLPPPGSAGLVDYRGHLVQETSDYRMLAYWPAKDAQPLPEESRWFHETASVIGDLSRRPIGLARIGEVYDSLRARHPDLTLDAFHRQLLAWQQADTVQLGVVNDARLESQDMLAKGMVMLHRESWGPEGYPRVYVQLTPQGKRRLMTQGKS